MGLQEMKSYLNEQLVAFLDDAGAKQPTPGGGSCAALIGAVGVSLAQMAARYTLGSKRCTEHHEAVEKILEQLGRLQGMFRELMVEDMAAYEAYAGAAKGKDGTPEQRERFRLAMRTATAVPLEILGTATAALRAIAELKGKCSPFLLSDLSSGGWAIQAAAMAAAENVRVNLAQFPDVRERAKIEDTLNEQLSHVSTLRPMIGIRFR